MISTDWFIVNLANTTTQGLPFLLLAPPWLEPLADAVVAGVVDGVLRPEAATVTDGVLRPDVPVVGVLCPVVEGAVELVPCPVVSKDF